MENLKNQERQPANAATPEKAEEKGQTPKQGKKEARPLTPEEDARVSVVLSRVFGSDVADIRSFGQRRAIKGRIQRGCPDAGGQGAVVG